MTRHIPLALLAMLLASLTLLLAGRAAADEAQGEAAAGKDGQPASPWLRLIRSESGEPVALQTATVRYTAAGDDGPTVDLIGVIHVGDRSYYEALNRQFKRYDALLFELVAPKDFKVQPGQGSSSRHPVGAVQSGMKNLLNLEHQLDIIDYRQKNFIHADMSPEEFAKTMAERDESFMQMFLRLMGQAMAQQSKQQAQGKSADFEIFAALFDKNRPVRLKRIMAEQFEQLEAMTLSLSGPDGSTIITERNKVALAVLEEQIKAGKKEIGIFYGAGHMDDMDKRLREQFQLVPGQTQWLTAWDLKLPQAK